MIDGGKRLGSGDSADNTKPLITVVTVVRNGASTIEKAMNSVFDQSFRNFEYLVVDGASTDGTVALIEKHGERIDYWMSRRDTGIYDAWNSALAQARGQWISFLGADDTYCANALDDYAKFISNLTETKVQYVSSRVELIKDGKAVRTIGSAWSWPAFSRYMTIAHVGSMHHRSLFEEYGHYDDRYRICGDYEMLLRPRHELRASFLNLVTARMAVGGISNTNIELALLEQERAKRETGKRAPWLCTLERNKAYLTARFRSFLWY